MSTGVAAARVGTADALVVATARHTGRALAREQAARSLAAVGGGVAADARAHPLLLTNARQAQRRFGETGAFLAGGRAVLADSLVVAFVAGPNARAGWSRVSGAATGSRWRFFVVRSTAGRERDTGERASVEERSDHSFTVLQMSSPWSSGK